MSDELDVGNLGVNLTLNTSAFDSKAPRVNSSLKQIEANLKGLSASNKNLEKSFRSSASSISGFVIKANLAKAAIVNVRDVFLSFPASILKSTGEFERLTKLMEGLRTETDLTRRQLGAMKDTDFVITMSQNVPFEITAVQDAFVKLKTAGIDPTNGSLQALIDSVAKYGGNSDVLKRASIAIQQMSGKGVISMEELRQQLGEAVPDAMKLMAYSMGMELGEFVNKVSRGTVESTNAINNMFREMQIRNSGSAEALMNTWTGLMSRLETQWKLFQKRVGEGGFADSMKEEVSAFIDDLSGSKFDSAIDKFTSLTKVATGAVGVVRELLTNYNDFIVNAAMGMAAYKGVSLLTRQRSSEEKSAAAQNNIFSRLNALGDSHRSKQLESLSGIKSGQEDELMMLREQLAEKKRIASQEIESERAKYAEIAQQKQKGLEYSRNNARNEVAAREQRAAQELAVEQKALADLEALLAKKRAAYSEYTQHIRNTGGKTPYTKQVISGENEDLRSLSRQVQKQREVVSAKQQGVVASRQMTAAQREEIAERERDIAVLQRQAQAQATASAETRAAIAALNDQIEKKKEDISKTNALIVKTNETAKATNILAGAKQYLASQISQAWSNAKMMLGSLAGMGVQMAALSAAIYVVNAAWSAFSDWLDVVVNKEEKLAEVHDRVRRGLGSKEDLESLKAGKDRDEKILAYEGRGILDDLGSFATLDWGSMDAWGGAYKKEAAAARKRLETINSDIQALENRNEETKLRSRVDEALREAESAYKKVRVENADRLNNLTNEAWLKANGMTIKQGKEERDKLLASVGDQFQQTEIYKRLQSEFSKLRDSSNANEKVAGYEFFEEIKRYTTTQGRLNASGELQSIDGKKKKTGTEAVQKDNFQAWIDQIRVQAVSLEAENKALAAGVDEYVSIQEQAAAAINKKIALGAWDTKVRNDKGKAVGLHKFGGNSRGEFSAAEQAKYNSAVEAQAELLRQKTLNSVLESSAKKLREVREVLNETFVEVDGEFQKHSTGIQSILKNYAALQTKGMALNDSEKALLETRKNLTVAYQAAIDASSELVEIEDEMKERELDNIDDTDTRNRAMYDRRVKEINDTYKLRVESINKVLTELEAANQTETAQYQEMVNVKSAIDKTYYAGLRNLNEKHAKDTETEMEKLVNQWNDMSGQMKSASANWANDFVDMTVEAFNTGKIEWCSFLTSMLTDMNRILIQKTWGGLIGGIFDSIGQQAGSALSEFASPAGNYLRSLFGFHTDAQQTGTGVIANTIGSGVGSAIGSVTTQDPSAAVSQMGSVASVVTSNLNTLSTGLLASTGGLSQMTSGVVQGTQQFGLLNTGMSVLGIATQAASTVEETASLTTTAALTELSVAATTAASSLMSLSASSTASSAESSSGGLFGGLSSLFSFAKGGVMSSVGSLPLKKYAFGGVANNPQMAIFGEGSMNEAFVPLPDGRSIPVTFANTAPVTGAGTVNAPVYINIEVNNTSDGRSSQQQQVSSGDMSKSWGVIANKVKGLVIQEINTQKRPGGLLYGGK